MANKVGSYIGNLGKSISYAAIDVLKDNTKNTAGFIETNADLFKEIYADVKDYNKTFIRISGVVRDSKIYKAANEYKSSLFEDIKSGKFYNKDEDRANRLNSAASGGLTDGFDEDMDIGDFDLGDDWGDDTEDTGESRTVSAIERTTKASVEANSMAIAKTGEYIVANNRAANNILFNQNAQSLNLMSEGFNSIGKEINLIRQSIAGPIVTHAENSKKYFESSLGTLEKISNTLAEMNARQSKQYETVASANANKKKKVGYNDVVDAGGMPDLKEYMNVIGKNAKKIMGPTGDMLLGDTFGEGSNMLMAFVESPLSFIPKILVKSLVPNILKTTLEGVDKTIGTLFGNMVARFNKMTKGDNPIMQKIGELFGINTQSKNSLDTSKYKKDAIPFDGITKKAIVEVMPGYLRNIEKLLSGKTGNIYDYGNGKWTTEKDVAKDWKRVNEEDPRNQAFSDIIPYLKKTLEKVRPERKEDYDALQNDMGKLLDYIYNNDGVFKVNDKEEMKKVQSDISVSDASMAVLVKAFKKADRSLMYGLSPNVLEAKAAKTKKMNTLEDEGISPLIQMNNNSIDKTAALSTKTNAYTNILVSTKDNKGNNLFYYLQSILGALVKGNMMGELPDKDKYGKPIKYKNKATETPSISSLIGAVPDNRPDSEKKTQKQRDDERYESGTARAKKKGQTRFYDRFGDEENIAKVNAELEMQSRYAKMDKLRDERTNGDWFAKLEPGEDKYNKEGKKLSLMDRLLSADSLTSKFKVMQDSIQDIVKMPTNFLVATMESADKRLYQLLFGYEGDERDKNGKPIKGFLGHMLNESSKSFDHFNKYIDENILSPLKKKLGIENFGDLFDKMASFFGFDEDRRDGIRNKVKEFFKPFGDSINKAFAEALEATKSAVRDTYNPVIDLVTPEDRKHGNDAASIFAVNHRMDLDNPLDKIINNATGITRMEEYDANKEDHDKRGKELADTFNGIGGSVSKRKKARRQRKLDIAANNEAGIEIEGYAKGTKYITKSGITAISKGEMIIPANLNPLNPDRYNVDLGKQSKNEDKIKRDYIAEITKRLKFNIGKNGEGTAAADPNAPLDEVDEVRDPLKAGTKDANSTLGKVATGAKKVVDTTSQATKEAAKSASYLYKRLIGDPKSDDKALAKALGEIGKNIKEYAPDAVGYGLVGGTASLLTGMIGGPLLGAAAGAAIGIVKKSKGLQDILFGKVDEETDERIGGVISADFQKKFEQYFPDMKTLGIAGAVTGLLTPFGPIGGLMIGSALGFAKNNTGIQKFLFGELDEETGENEGGLISNKLQKLIKASVPKMFLGAAGTLLLGPFGIVGNAALGAGLGLVASTDKFKDIMFGKADENGDREGGIIGAIRTGVVDPIKDALVGFKETFLDFMKENVMNPLKDFISPMGQELRNMFDNIGKSISGFFTDRFEKSIGIPLDQLIKEHFVQPMSKFFGGVFKATLAPTAFIATAPFKALGGIGNHMRRGQIKKGTAGDMTAEQRLQFMKDKPGLFGGKYKTEDLDMLMKDQDIDTLRKNRDNLGLVEGGRGYFEKKIGTSKHKMSEDIVSYLRKNKLDSMMTPKQRNQFIKAAQDGDMDFAKEILRTTHKNGSKKMGKEDQEGLTDILTKYSKEIEESKESQKGADRSKKDILKELATTGGMKGINSDNVSKYLAMYETEYRAKKRLGKNATADDAEDPVMAKIISDKSNAQITLLERLVSILEDHYGIKKSNDSVKVEKADKDKDETFTTTNANGEPITFKTATDGSSIGATADDKKKIEEGKEAAKTQKGILNALTSSVGKVGDTLIGKTGEDSEDEEKGGKKSSLVSRILKGIFSSKATKVVAGVIGGVTGVALVGHMGKWWDEKAFPAIKNWVEESAFGQKIVSFLGDIATNVGSMFTNITDWFSGSGKFNGMGFPYFWKEGVIPFYTIGISYFLENMLPNLIETAFKTLPHLLMGVVKGIGGILKTPINQLLGKEPIGKGEKEEPISLTASFKESLSSNMAVNSNVPGGNEYLRTKFGNIGRYVGSSKETTEKYIPSSDNRSSDKNGGTVLNDDGTELSYSYDDYGNPKFDAPSTTNNYYGQTSPATSTPIDIPGLMGEDGTQSMTGSEIYNQTKPSNGKPPMFAMDNIETTGEAVVGGPLRSLLTGRTGAIGALANTKIGQGLSRIPVIGKLVDLVKGVLRPLGKVTNAAASKGHGALVDMVTRAGGPGLANILFGGKAGAAAGHNFVSGALDNVYKNASEETIQNASREYVERKAKERTAKTGIELSKEFIDRGTEVISKGSRDKIASKLGIGTMGEIADTAIREGTEGVARAAVEEGAENIAKKGALAPIIEWVTKQLGKLFANNTVLGKVAEGISMAGSKVAGGATKAAQAVLEKILAKVVKVFGEHAAKSVAKVVAKFATVIGSAGLMSIAFAVADFLSGFNNANSILGITDMPSFGMRLVTGLVKSVNGFVTMGIFPEDILVDIFVNFLAPVLKIDTKALSADRDAAVSEIEKWNSTHDEDEQYSSVEQYNKKDKIGTKIKKGFSDTWDGVKSFFGGKDDKDEKKAAKENVLDTAVDSVNASLRKTGAAVREYGDTARGLPIVTEATDPNPKYTKEGIWIQPYGTVSGIDYNKLTYTTEANAGGGTSANIVNKAIDPSNITKALTPNANGSLKMVGKPNASYTSPTTGTVVPGKSVISKGSVSNDGITPTTIYDDPNSILGKSNYDAIDNGGKQLEQSYNSTKVDLNDTKTDMSKFFDNSIKETTPLSGVQKAAFYTKKLFAIGPLMFNRVTSDIADQFGLYSKDLSSATKYISTVDRATKKEIGKIDSDTKFDNLFKDQRFSNPFKKIIHWTNKILSFPLYMAKYMTKQISDTMSDGGALDAFGTFDKLVQHLNGNTETTKANHGITGFGTDPSMSTNYEGTTENGVPVYKQGDPSIANIRFNNPDDTKRQTIKDSGCAPVNAANIINGINGNTSMTVQDAANYAIANGFKVQDGGTDINYFSSILGDHNISSTTIPNDPKQITNYLASNKPVILLGKGDRRVGPFGKSPHFVTATGLDKNGNVIVQNPESKEPFTTYKINDLLKHTTNALAVGGNMSNKMKGMSLPGYGYGTSVDPNKIAGIAATIVSQSEGDYSSVNGDDNGSMSIGKIQWNANSGRALPLLRKIVALNPSNAKSILGNTLYAEIANGPDTLWTRRSNMKNGRKASSSEKTKISKLLDTKEGHDAQNALIARDVPMYINYGMTNGITAPDALIYFADVANQYGSKTAWNKIKAGCGGSYTLDNLHNTMLKTGKYTGRRNACYEMCKKWEQYPAMDTTGATNGSIPSSSTNSVGTIFDSITNIGNSLLKQIWGADNVKAIFGDLEGIDGITFNTGAKASPYNGTSINNFPYFNQADPRWGKELYSVDGTPSETMASSACGPTALSMIAKSYGIQTDPLKMAKFSLDHGWRVKNAGTSHALMTKGANELGLESKEVNDKTAYEKVKAGFPVVSSVGPGHFTKKGHFITLVGVDEKGNYLVNDPSSVERSQKPWSESLVSSETNHNWVMSKDSKGSIGKAQGLGSKSNYNVDTRTIKNILPQSKSELNGAATNTVMYRDANNQTNTTSKEATYMKVLGIIVDVLCKIADNTDKLSEVIKILNEKFDLNIKPEKTDKEKSVTKEAMKRAITQSMKGSDGIAGSGSNKSSMGKDAESIIRSLRMIASE